MILRAAEQSNLGREAALNMNVLDRFCQVESHLEGAMSSAARSAVFGLPDMINPVKC